MAESPVHPYVPLTPLDERKMLDACGLSSVGELFECIPESVRRAFEAGDLPPRAMPESAVTRELGRLAARNTGTSKLVSFVGGGCYDHHVPSIVPALVFRAEFATAYTPYQPEVSQGTLQAIFEFQTLVCNLAGLEVANASLYDGATAAAEAALLACAATRRGRVLVSAGLNPRYTAVLETYLRATDRELCRVPMDPSGRTAAAGLSDAGAAALVVGYPGYHGCIEDLRDLRERLDSKTLLVAVVNPVALGLLAPPGQLGADIVVGEAGSLGVGQSYGGPGLGFIAVRESLVRRVPGRLVGMARDSEGRRGYVLTLQAREQHIRRSRAASNICTNQSLAALAATIHLCALGREGMRELAELNYHKAHHALRSLTAVPGVSPVYAAPFFNEFTLRLPAPVGPVLERLVEREGIAGGIDLGDSLPGVSHALLVAVTEQRSREEIDRYAEALARSLQA